jgi:branched-subunit amino acid transport protein AzlD
VISALSAHCYYHRDESRLIDPRSNGMDEYSLPSKRNKQEIQAMNHHLSAFFGAIAAWLCLAPVAFARASLSMPGTLALDFTPVHHIVKLSLLLIWIAGGIFLVVGGILAFAPFRFRERKSDQLSGSVQALVNTEIDLAWTVIPLLVLVLFLV